MTRTYGLVADVGVEPTVRSLQCTFALCEADTFG